MTGNAELPEGLRDLVNRHLSTMDHVAVLLELRERAEQPGLPADVARATRLDDAVAARVLRDLVHAHLVVRDGERVRYDPPLGVRPAVDELAEMNRRKPVTLVKAIYARPPRAVQSFADAFRLRGSGE